MKRKKIEGVKDKRERGREIRGLRKNWREKKREGERDKDLKEKKIGRKKEEIVQYREGGRDKKKGRERER